MPLGAVYLWEPELFNGIAPSLNNSEQVAYELYQQHRDTVPQGNVLLDWVTYMRKSVTNPSYNEYFSDEIQQWIIDLEQGLIKEPCAILELEHFDHFAQGDALYRVFYEAIQASGVGCYEPRFAVWAVGTQQVPINAVNTVLSSWLKPLNTEPQSFDLTQIEAPRNIKKAEELMRLWSAQHPILKKYELHAFYRLYDFIALSPRMLDEKRDIPDLYRNFIYIQKSQNITYQLRYILSGLTSFPQIDFTMDLTGYFLSSELKEKYPKKLLFTLNPTDIRDTTEGPKKTADNNLVWPLKFHIFYRWETAGDVKASLNVFDQYIHFLDQHLPKNGNFHALQAWAYGDVVDNTLLLMHWTQELLIIALGLDHEYLEQRYLYHLNLLAEPKYESQKKYLESTYQDYLKLMSLIEEAGTAVPAYRNKVNP